MSARGNCYDNAVVESFFGLLKRERVNRTRYLTRDEAKQHNYQWARFSMMSYEHGVQFRKGHRRTATRESAAAAGSFWPEPADQVINY